MIMFFTTVPHQSRNYSYGIYNRNMHLVQLLSCLQAERNSGETAEWHNFVCGGRQLPDSLYAGSTSNFCPSLRAWNRPSLKDGLVPRPAFVERSGKIVTAMEFINISTLRTKTVLIYFCFSCFIKYLQSRSVFHFFFLSITLLFKCTKFLVRIVQ